MRFERKYRIEGLSLAEVKQVLRFHPASFRPLFPDRQVNNIYFDTPSLVTFHLNVAGVGQRKKYRVRWYGEEPRQIQKPKFEIKIKDNELGEKETFEIAPFDLDHLDAVTQAANELHGNHLLLKPVLLNSYRRAYFGSMDGKFRITLDTEMRYHRLLTHPNFSRYLVSDSAIILEIKYEEEHDHLANKITQQLPFRQSKHSKYVVGVEVTR